MSNEVAEITVQYVNFPKEGKKWGNIKTSEGQFFGAAPEMLRQFKVGEVCKIEYKVTEAGYNNLLKKIGESVRPAPLSPPPRQRTNPVDNEHIFITALLKEFIASKQCGLVTSEIMQAVNTIRDAYRLTLGGLEKQRRDDMDDEIPH